MEVNYFGTMNSINFNKSSDLKEIKLKIMNHPVFLMNNNFKFYEESDENGKLWFCFYFNVMNYKLS